MISKKNVLSDRNNAVKKKSKYSETLMTHIQMQDQKGEKTHCLCLINAHQLQKKKHIEHELFNACSNQTTFALYGTRI